MSGEPSDLQALVDKWRSDNNAIHRKYTDAGGAKLTCADELEKVLEWLAGSVPGNQTSRPPTLPDDALMMIAEQQIDWVAEKLAISRSAGRLALLSVLIGARDESERELAAERALAGSVPGDSQWQKAAEEEKVEPLKRKLVRISHNLTIDGPDRDAEYEFMVTVNGEDWSFWLDRKQADLVIEILAAPPGLPGDSRPRDTDEEKTDLSRMDGSR